MYEWTPRTSKYNPCHPVHRRVCYLLDITHLNTYRVIVSRVLPMTQSAIIGCTVGQLSSDLRKGGQHQGSGGREIGERREGRRRWELGTTTNIGRRGFCIGRRGGERRDAGTLVKPGECESWIFLNTWESIIFYIFFNMFVNMKYFFPSFSLVILQHRNVKIEFFIDVPASHKDTMTTLNISLLQYK